MRPTRIGSAALAVAAVAAVVAVARPARADVAVQASADRTTVGADDTFQITVRASGAREVELAATPQTRDFEVLGRSRATEVSIRNGGAPETTQQLILTVRPLRTGKLTFPALTIDADGKRANTTPLAIEVVPGHAAGPARPSQDPFAALGFGGDPFGDDDDLADMMRRMQSSVFAPRPSKNDVLVRASVDNPHPYVGEQTTLSLHLLTRVPLSSVQLTRFPSVVGATADDLATPKEPEPRIVEVGGVRYQSVLLARKALFPLRAGVVEVPAIEVAADTGGFGGGYRVTKSSAPLRFTARALPSGGRADEAVGHWKLSASASPQHAVAGEPLTIRVAAEGTGDLHALSLPAPVVPRGWRAYAPSTHDTPAVNGTRLGGTRVVDTVVVPDRAGRFVVEVPPLAYFDPARHRHSEAAAPPLVVEVTAAPAAVASTPAVASPTAPTAARTRPSHNRLLALAVALAIAVAGAFLLLLLAAARRRRSSRPLSGRARLRRARRHLQLAAALRARGRTAQVYDELARSLQHAVGAVAPRSATSPARLDQHLAAAGVAPQARDALVAAADAVDAGRFAPTSDDAQAACTLTAAALAAAERTPPQRASTRSSLA